MRGHSLAPHPAVNLAEVPCVDSVAADNGSVKWAPNTITCFILKSYINYIDTLNINKTKITYLLSQKQ